MSASNVLLNTTQSFQGMIPEVRPSTIQRSNPIFSRISQGKPITVGRLLSKIKQTPQQTMLLGQCQDGLPILMGLDDPTVGAVLISGENSCGKTHQLQVMVESLIRRHTPDDLQISILTLHPEEWAYLQQDHHRQKFIHTIRAWYDHRSEKMIRELSEIAEFHRDGNQSQTRQMVILDDLNFIEYLSYVSQINIHWLLTYGVQLGFTMLATINAVYCNDYRYWIDIFRTRILGKIDLQDEADTLAMRPGSSAEILEPGFFRIWTEHDWLTYRLPLLGD